jgi:DNA-binding FadR family transcriptional regulator
LFKPVKKTKVYEEIVSKVKLMIRQGKLKIGDQLPAERELSEVFKVSRSSVREALRTLESQGFLESRQGNGTYIARQPVELLITPLAGAIFTEKDVQIELFEMRRLIEPQLAYLAAERATPEEISRMEKLLVKQEEQLAEGDTATEVDKSFHRTLAEATKNSILIRIIEPLMDSISSSRDRYLQVEGRPHKSFTRHKQLLMAIKAGDSELAAQVMREHIEDVEISLFSGRRKEESIGTNREGEESQAVEQKKGGSV